MLASLFCWYFSGNVLDWARADNCWNWKHWHHRTNQLRTEVSELKRELQTTVQLIRCSAHYPFFFKKSDYCFGTNRQIHTIRVILFSLRRLKCQSTRWYERILHGFCSDVWQNVIDKSGARIRRGRLTSCCSVCGPNCLYSIVCSASVWSTRLACWHALEPN